MDRFSFDQLAELLDTHGSPTLSIYLPSHRGGPEKQGDQLRLRNLLDEAERRLLFQGLSNDQAAELLAEARALLDNELFWRHQEDGLAIFAAPGFSRSYRLPLRFEEVLHIGRSFSLRPLLPMLDSEGLFFLLALSEKEVRLLRCTRDSVSQEGLETSPASLAANEQYAQRERYLGFYTRGSGSGARFYGASSASDLEEAAQEDFALRVARAVDEELAGETAPLLIAAVEELGHMVRHQLRYPATMETVMAGSPDLLSPEQLRQRAEPLVAPLLEEQRHKELARLAEGLGTGRAEAQSLPLVQAALEGRVETLFVSPRASLAGRIDARSGLPLAGSGPGAAPGPGEEDLLDLAVSSTLRNRGRIYLATDGELPDKAAAAAVLRF